MPRINGGIPVARKTLGSEPEVRAYLLERAVEFRRMIVESVLDDPEFTKYAWRECSKPVDQLACGAAVSVSRYQLPDWCAESAAGHPCDNLRLTAGDELEER
jgi:hypothetical protein